jgi:hypothetical protein
MRGPVKAPKYAVTPPEVSVWRWISLIAVFVSIAHDKLHRQSGEVGLADLLAGTPLAPAGSVFRAWPLILFVVLAYAVFQLGEVQRRLTVYDRASRPLALACGLGSAQLVALAEGGGLWVAAPLAVAMAAAAGVAYHRVYAEIAAGRASAWIGAPLSLLVGYTGAAAVVALDAMLWRAGVGTTAPAVGLLIAACAGVIHLGLSRRDAIAPAFAAWVLTSICAARPSEAIATTALIAGALCGTAAIVIVAAQLEARDARRAATQRPRSRRRATALR